MLPNKLYCVTFITQTGRIYKQSEMCKFTLIKYKQLQNSAVYYREDKPIHLYEIADDDKMTVINTNYNLTEIELNAVRDLNQELYENQPEYLFYAGEESEYTSFTEQSYEILYGVITYPQFVSKTKSKLNEYCIDVYMSDVDRELKKVQNTIEMYLDDNKKTSESFKKVAIDTTIDVADLKLGAQFYRYVEGVGVLNFVLKDIIHVSQIHRNIYHLLCTSCNHEHPCEVYVSHIIKDRYSYVGNVHHKSEHDYYHNDDKYHFHTSKQGAFQDYLNKIQNYNSTVLNEYNERRELLNFTKTIVNHVTK